MHLVSMHTAAALNASLPALNLFLPPVKALSDVFSHLTLMDLARLFARNAARINHYYLLFLNLSALASAAPRCLGGTEPKLLRAEEFEELYARLRSLESDDKRELMSRLLFYRSGFRNCYTIASDGATAFLEWIIFPAENEIIQKHYRTRFLPLESSEVMLENSFTFPAYRGRGLMPFATWQLLNKAKELGYRRAVTYIRKEKIDSLNHFLRMGFTIKRIVREIKLLGYTWRSL